MANNTQLFQALDSVTKLTFRKRTANHNFGPIEWKRKHKAICMISNLCRSLRQTSRSNVAFINPENKIQKLHGKWVSNMQQCAQEFWDFIITCCTDLIENSIEQKDVFWDVLKFEQETKRG